MVTTERRSTDPGSDLERNKAVVRQFIERVFVAGDAAAVDELATEDFTPHSWGQQPGRDALKATQQRAGAGLSDVSFTIDEMVAEGDLVAVRVTSSARQTGDFMGLPASGKRYTIPEMHFFRLRDGRVSEHWHEFNVAGLMQQLKGDARSNPRRRR